MLGLQSVAAEVVKGQVVHEVKVVLLLTVMLGNIVQLQNMCASEVYGIKRFFLESTRMFDHMTSAEAPATAIPSGIPLGGDTTTSGGSRLRKFRK